MKINKVTTGFVIQTYDTDLQRWTGQEFVAGTETDYEEAGTGAILDSAAIWPKSDEPYLPFVMRQPDEIDRESMPRLSRRHYSSRKSKPEQQRRDITLGLAASGQFHPTIKQPQHPTMNTTNHVITFAADGTARCLWTEAVPLQELGVLEVQRASDVEFNPAKQVWEVRLASNPSVVAFSHSSRAICLHWEREALQ